MTNSSATANKNPRKHIRFEPDIGTVALIDVNLNGQFNPTINGLTLQESYGGAALLVASSIGLKETEIVRIKVGDLHVMHAEIRWVKSLESTVYKVGVQYLE